MLRLVGFRVKRGARYASGWAGFVSDCVAMPRSVDFGGERVGKKKLCIVGTKESLQGLVGSEVIPEGVAGVYKRMVDKVELKPLKCATLTHKTFSDDADALEELTIGCITTEASRHSSPHRADQIRDFATKHIPMDATAAVILAAPSEEAVYSYVTSVPKGQHLARFKTKKEKGGDGSSRTPVTVLAGGAPVAVSWNEKANIIAESVQLAGRLVDAPANYLNTESYSQIVAGVAERFDIPYTLIKNDALLDEGLTTLHSVGRAAEYGSVLATLSHVVPDTPTTCWAGKGVVYDTGGLSIKPTAGMLDMKQDMGGSASVFAAFIAAVRLGVPTTHHALLALADNAINDKAHRPGDIITCYSGKTIEINNTDAEGRLVLADAVAYAHKKFSPSSVVDVATLTGAQGVATGKHFAAICANTEEVETTALKAAKESGDQCFPVVYAPEFHLAEFESKLADMTNNVANRANAQVSCAGLFIYDCAFGGSYKGDWLHVDMAYPVSSDSKSTGFGVPLLLRLAKAA